MKNDVHNRPRSQQTTFKTGHVQNRPRLQQTTFITDLFITDHIHNRRVQYRQQSQQTHSWTTFTTDQFKTDHIHNQSHS